VKKSILLFGGRSEERLVSVASAQNLMNHFDFSELWFIQVDGNCFAVDESELSAHERPFESPFSPKKTPFARSVEEAIVKSKDNVFFIALHGTEGEDGQLQSAFESERVFFTGSGSHASHCCFEKVKAKKVIEAAQIPTAPQLHLKTIKSASLRSELAEFLRTNKKIVVKPVESGSSIGLHIVAHERELDSVVEKMLSAIYTHYLAEKFIDGRELTVGVFTDRSASGKTELVALPPSEVLLQSGHAFDYEGKYLGHGTKEITPADLTETERKAAQKIAIDSHKALGCFGYSRTDMILTSTGPVFLETNTLPGLSKMSFVPQQLVAAKISVHDFVKGQIDLALHRYA
jgi:D-alanine-D-alanine ligase